MGANGYVYAYIYLIASVFIDICVFVLHSFLKLYMCRLVFLNIGLKSETLFLLYKCTFSNKSLEVNDKISQIKSHRVRYFLERKFNCCEKN